MSDNIPIDILDAANSAYMLQLEMAEEAVTAGEHKNMMVIEIAKAIYAERERCALICEGRGLRSQMFMNEDRAKMGNYLAKIIREAPSGRS